MHARDGEAVLFIAQASEWQVFYKYPEVTLPFKENMHSFMRVHWTSVACRGCYWQMSAIKP
jgi:hypothetical protein